MTLDPDGTILAINHTLQNLSTEDLIGTDVMSYVEERERAAYAEALDDVVSNGVSRSLELSTPGLSWLTRLIPIKYEDVVETVLVIAADMSERKKFETQVQHAQKLESLAVLTAGIAHDFNNLLTGILGSASLASSMLPEGSPAEEQVARILQAAEKAADLTNQMLAYAGKQDFEVGFVDLNQFVSDVIPLVRTAIAKNTNIHGTWAANLPAIEADPVQLRQVIVALVTNASEALQDGRTWRGLDSHGSTQERSLGNTRLRRDLRHRARHGRRDLRENLRPLLYHEVHRAGARSGGRAGDRPSPPR